MVAHTMSLLSVELEIAYALSVLPASGAHDFLSCPERKVAQVFPDG
jgi:hypothetical protein